MPTPVDSLQATNYNNCGAVDDYEFVPGVCVLPIAEPPPTDPTELAEWSPVITLQLHAPYRVRRTTYVADKQRNPPVLPTPQSAGAFEFTAGSISFSKQLSTSFGDFNWSVTGVYEFVEVVVSRAQDGFVLCQVPFELTQNQLNYNVFFNGNTPQDGAIADAGANAVVGYTMGRLIDTTNPNWQYNDPAFFPAQLLNDQLVNGGGTGEGQTQAELRGGPAIIQ